MARTLPLGLAPEWDRDFTVGVGVSVLLHVAVAALVVFLATMAPAPLPPLQSYTVELTDPSALGGRLAFGPLDRPIGRPARIAPASGGAPEGPPRTGEPAAMVPPKPTKAEPVKIAEAPPPTSPPPTSPPVTVPPPTVPAPTLPPSTLPPSTVPPASAPPSTVPPPPTIPPSAAVSPKPVEPPREPERPKRVETAKTQPVETPVTKSPDASVALRAETKRPEPKPTPPQEAQITRPPPPPAPAKVEPRTEAKVEPKAPPKPELKPGAIKPERSAPAPTALAMKSADVKAPRTTPGMAPTPVPTAPATGSEGVGSGGSAEENVDKDFKAAAERWHSRMDKAEGGLDGAEGQQGPIGDGSDQGGGGAVVDTEYVIYSQRVSGIIKQNWVETDRKSGLVARVRFEISPDGEVSNIRLERSSGDKAYDLSVMRAVQRSSPLPPPPEQHRDDFHEMEIDFHPEEGGRASQ